VFIVANLIKHDAEACSEEENDPNRFSFSTYLSIKTVFNACSLI